MLHLRRSTAALALAAACLLASAAAFSEQVTVCGDGYSVLRLSCGHTERGVISVRTAFYGRADKTTCSKGRPYGQLANTNCAQKGTLELIRGRCDGKKVCELNSRVACISDPCPGTFKYLQTTYTCLTANHLIVCEKSSALLQCDGGQVISVKGADYGRSDRTTCAFQRPYKAIRNTNCHRPTTKVAESCNGKKSCVVSAENSVFGDPCCGINKYLELAYTCVFPY